MRNSAAKRVAMTGLLFALALILSYFESFLAPLFGLMPGVKIGLANIVVMYALLYLSAGQALLLVVLKAGFAFLVRGMMAGFLSLGGGVLSFAVMLVLLRFVKGSSLMLLSISGALAHNIGQLVVVRLFFGQFSLVYAPVLLITGLAMGVLTAFTLRALLPALERTGLAPGGGHSPCGNKIDE